MGFFDWLSGNTSRVPSNELIQSLDIIGLAKNKVSGVSSQTQVLAADPSIAPVRGLFNLLGLYVQQVSVDLPPSTTGLDTSVSGWTLQAGTQTNSYFDAWRIRPDAEWVVISYRHGSWERLVGPTLDLAVFISNMDGDITERVKIVKSIGDQFKKTGVLKLPEFASES